MATLFDQYNKNLAVFESEVKDFRFPPAEKRELYREYDEAMGMLTCECKYCASKRSLKLNFFRGIGEDKKIFKVWCRECKASGPINHSPLKATKSWLGIKD